MKGKYKIDSLTCSSLSNKRKQAKNDSWSLLNFNAVNGIFVTEFSDIWIFPGSSEYSFIVIDSYRQSILIQIISLPNIHSTFLISENF